jgi:hypothetical protein
MRKGDFVAGTRTWLILALTLALWLLVGTTVHAQSLNAAMFFTPNSLNVDVKKDDHDVLQEARFNTGLGFKLRSELLQFAVDYKVQVQLKDKMDDADLSQRVGARFYSSALNRILGLEADVRAGSTIKQGGDAYVYSITPGLTKSFSDLATLSVQYQYMLNQANAKAMEKEKTGYRMGLSGKARGGRLTWKGHYGSTDVSGGAWQLQSTELLEFESRYQLGPELRFEFSGRSKNETMFDQGLEHDFFNETRYGAGLAWSPSQYYSVAFKVNKLSESSKDNEDIFGSGILSWFPNREMEFTISYGDHPVGGARAFMLGTKINLSGS